MSIILSKSLTHENQSLELVVKYDTNSNIAELKSIWLISHGKQIPVGNIMMQYFGEAVTRIIDETDWKEVYREMGEDTGAAEVVNDLFKTLGSYFEPQKSTP